MRLKEDNSSWKSGGVRRRMYRQAPLTPEDEVPRLKSMTKKYKKKHVHTWERRVDGMKTAYRYHRVGDDWERVEYQVPKERWVCTGCGNKSAYYWGW